MVCPIWGIRDMSADDHGINAGTVGLFGLYECAHCCVAGYGPIEGGKRI